MLGRLLRKLELNRLLLELFIVPDLVLRKKHELDESCGVFWNTDSLDLSCRILFSIIDFF